MYIVDSQIHLFGPNAEAEAAQIKQIVMSPEQVVSAMNGVGVERAYLVPINSEGNPPCLDAQKRWPERFRVMGIISLNKPEARELMSNWKAVSSYAGLRLSFPPFRKVSWLKDGTADWFWPEAEKYELPIMIWAPQQIDEVGKLAHRYPGIRFIIDHLGLFVDDIGGQVRAKIEDLLPLAKYENVAAKASALPSHSAEGYPFRDLHLPIRMVVEAFGPERVIWGTDLTRLACTYNEAITMFTEELSFLSPKDLKHIMADSAIRWLGW
jgi:L-fuconolactonase